MGLLKVENLNKVYGTKRSSKKYRALNQINFQVSSGEFLGVMGPSGSGKTTLLNILGSLDVPTSGRVFLAGQDITGLRKRQLAKYRIENIGFIFQDYNLLETMTLRENIILPLALHGGKVKTMEARLQKLGADLDILGLLDKYPYEVSGGEQQRAAACRALITNPKIILADEPTGNLDSRTSRSLLELLVQINQAYKTTILMVTHDVFAASYCQRIIFIRDGEIYNQLYAGDDKQQFFDRIISVISTLGGDGK